MVTNNVLFSSMADTTPLERESALAAAEYNRMIRDRAGSILSPEQFAVYVEMQQEELEGRPRIQTLP